MANDVNDIYFLKPAILTTGKLYTGNQQFKGIGVVRWCIKCDAHRSVTGGRMNKMFGALHWVCHMHPKKEAAK